MDYNNFKQCYSLKKEKTYCNYRNSEKEKF